MFSAVTRAGYTIYQNIAYPVDITNTGTSTTTVAITGNSSVFTSSSVTVSAGSTATIYVATHSLNETLVLTDNNTTVNLTVVTQEHLSTIEYGDPSYISVFELPGGIGEVIPTLENIHLLMRQGHYCKAVGEMKIWRPDTL